MNLGSVWGELGEMQPERVRRFSNPQLFSNDLGERGRETDSVTSTEYLSAASLPSSNARLNYIEHPVSKMDTLAGVAIKYGVEVADIKRMNGLVTDLQMFALRSLQIPLPGRHPPSRAMGNGSAAMRESSNGKTGTRQPYIDVLESFQPFKLKPSQRSVSPAMSSLQGYYGLTPSKSKNPADGTEMVLYRKGIAKHLDAEQLPNTSPVSEPPPTRHRKSRSLVNGFLPENSELLESLLSEAGDGESERSNDSSVRRRQKAETETPSPTPEMILKVDSNSGGGLSGRAGKGLALRPKSGSRVASPADAEPGQLNPIPFGDSASIADGFANFRKSSSTSNLQSSDNGTTSLWPTAKRSLKSDLQALSTAAIARPIFDGLPKPITSRRNKAALD